MFNSAKSLHSKIFAQNFLKDSRIVRDLIRRSGISDKDVVVEIGPGEGVITRELAEVAGRVVAIESDPKLAEKLRRKFKDSKNVTIVSADFLQRHLEEKDYAVFSNIPFNITNQIIKKLLYSENPPRDAYLFVQKEAALRLSGLPQEQEFAILTKPWFTYEIVHNFKRTDFIPIPSVDVVLLHIYMKRPVLLNPADTEAYRKFVRFGYRQQKKDLMTGLKNFFTYEQWRHMARDFKFPPHARTVELTAEQWVGIFKVFQERVESAKKKLIG